MLTFARLCTLAVVSCVAHAQYAEERAPRYIASASESKPAPTPVPILKQINRHNEDGSYTYGFEAADGSFKIETKDANGEVKGKYGYRDDSGKLRVIEYGANKHGFQPAGEGITVAPPTLVDETKEEQQRQRTQDGLSNYRSQPDYDYEDPAPAPRPAPRPAARPAPRRPAPAQTYRSAAPAPPKPAFFAGAAPAPVQDTNLFSPAPRAAPARPQPAADFRGFSQQLLQTQVEYSQPQEHQQQNYQTQSQNYQTQPQNYQTQPQNYQTQPQTYQTQPQNYQSQPQTYQPQQSYQPSFPTARQASFQPKTQPFSMLDELLKQYALPQGGAAPLHDITFGTF